MENFDLPIPKTITWTGKVVKIIDQTLLPNKCKIVTIKTPQEMWHAIKVLAIRGAPAIGCAAAYGLVLSAKQTKAKTTSQLLAEIKKVGKYLATSRPTAVNLFWAIDRIIKIAEESCGLDIKDFQKRLEQEANNILLEDQKMCFQIGKYGSEIVPKNGEFTILTHCNAGALATAGIGTALAVVYSGYKKNKQLKVYSDETRPLGQGSRLTSWELEKAGVPVTLICDNMAAEVMRENKIDMVVVGADRIAANGDTANKIGTYGVAVLAKYHKVPFYIAAPSSTFDLQIATGDMIPIEQRCADEVRKHTSGIYTAPKNISVYNPAFDVTPHELLTGIITEYGVIYKPTKKKIKDFFSHHSK